MSAKTQAPAATAATQRQKPSHPLYLNEGLSPKKTALIIVIVIGCIAILWPKVFHPMMFGGEAPKVSNPKEQRGPGGCCDVVLDRREGFLNGTTQPIGPQKYRKQLNLYTGELSIRQERPAHLHPESIYQAMRERGRAIPATPTIPIVERKGSPSNPPPRIVEGRPGPIPGMRPPMGAGALHQPQAKGSSMGFILPLYTIGIIVFFGYTIMKLVFKKPVPNAPYGPAPNDPAFRKEVFGQEANGRHVQELNGSKLGNPVPQAQHAHHQQQQQQSPHQHPAEAPVATNTAVIPASNRNGSELYNASLSAVSAASNLSTSIKQHQLQHHQQPLSVRNAKADLLNLNKQETEQLMEIEKLRKKLEDTEKAMAKLIAEMNSDQYEAKKPNENSTSNNVENISNGHTSSTEPVESSYNASNSKDLGQQPQQRKHREGSAERSVAVLGMELTASREGGQKWNSKRPSTPVFYSQHSNDPIDIGEPHSIYLEGCLAHESQILVAEAETRTEEVYDEDLNGTEDEPAVVLSSKMTLSLISLDSTTSGKDGATHKNEVESPLADDIEIIGHDEK